MPLLNNKLPMFVSLLVLTACTNPAQRPQVAYADTYSYSSPAAQQATADAVIDSEWWHAFASPALDELITLAQQGSPDLLMSAERVRQAELQLRMANATLFPSLTATASTGESTQKAGDNPSVRSESSRVSLGVNYEIDLWGGVAAGRASASASYDSTRFSQEAAVLSIKAAIASGWFQWLALQERIATAHKNIVIAERVQRIVDARYRNGAATAADVAQQKTNLLTQQASLLPLELQARQTQAALAILVGKTPQEFHLTQEQLLALEVPQIAPGTPADLVTRRPDLAAIEANLQRADADLVAARAALLPSIDLSASLGKSVGELFALNPATQSTGWTLSLAQTLFNGGRLVNQQRLKESQRVELVLQYHKAILTALQEVDDALIAVDIRARQEQSQRDILANAQRSLQLTEARYRAGTNDLLSLLDAQRSVFQAEDALVQQRLARLNAAVDLYKALGGGWTLSPR